MPRLAQRSKSVAFAQAVRPPTNPKDGFWKPAVRISDLAHLPHRVRWHRGSERSARISRYRTSVQECSSCVMVSDSRVDGHTGLEGLVGTLPVGPFKVFGPL